MENERRKHPRAPMVGMVSYAGSSGVDCDTIKDLSRGGMRLVATAPEKPGTKVALKLSLEGAADVLELQGQVVWARQAQPFEVGIQFLALDDKGKRLLSRLLESSSG